ncbi:NHL repeat protein [Oopsacas minuta]|uniref:NHL repeat protein n=1 Tax=Oopsacas minuta TaxID=111878 RepID=A0AAV7JAV7_9METZ|nr:NHL repeat protein [Oopsacas minuta]
MAKLFEKNTALVTKLYSSRCDSLYSIGKQGRGRKETRFIGGISLDEYLNIFIVDHGNTRIQIFTFEGYFISNFGGDLLSSPYAIAVKSNVAIISDVRLKCVIKFDGNDCTKVIRSDMREVKMPMGVTIDGNYNIYVADAKRNSVVVLNQDLRFIIELGKHELKCPRDVKIHGNNIIVCDNGVHKNVHIFNKDGELVRSIFKLKQGNSSLFMCIDKLGNIAVSDKVNREISISTFKGKLFQQWFTSGRPAGIEITKDGLIVRANYDFGLIYIHKEN